MLLVKGFVCAVLLASVESAKVIFLTKENSTIHKIGGRLYAEELLTDRFEGPKELAYDSSGRNLFFMYMDDALQNSGRAYINVVTKEARKINGIMRNKATAVDPDTSDVYFGSEDGLYKYEPVGNFASNIALYNVNVMKLVTRNNEMYLLDADKHTIYKVFDEGSTMVRVGDWQAVLEMDVDNDGNIHFVTVCGLYCAVRGHETVKNKDLSVVNNFIVDGPKVYGVTDDAIYDIDCRNGTAVKFSDMDFIPKSIVLGDYGDIYYSKDDSIYRLRPVSSYLIYNLHNRPNAGNVKKNKLV